MRTAGGYSPRVAKSADGKLWFVTSGGVSVIDPRHLPFNKLPPPVHIEQIIADGKKSEPSSGLASARAGPRCLRLTTRLSASSRRRRSVFDTSWRARIGTGRKSVNHRQVHYSNLRPAQLPIPRHRLVTTAACGTRPATRSIFPSPRRTIRPPGSVRRAWPLFWHCSGRCIAIASIRSRRNSRLRMGRAHAHRARTARHAVAELSGFAVGKCRRLATCLSRRSDHAVETLDEAITWRRGQSPKAGMLFRTCVPSRQLRTIWHNC